MGSSARRRVLLGALLGAVVAAFLRPRAAPATVEEQRARLPPPATCQDPVEGVWMSHKYETPWDEWMIFTLTIRRQGDGRLAGTIDAHAWFGSGPRAQEPPPCRGGLAHWVVAMTAQGVAQGLRVEFWGTRWAVREVYCGSRYFRYNLDHFTGTIDPALQEFQSVNNDGGRAINDPTVFRRVRCFDPVSPPHPYVAPPAFHPPRRSAGCGR